jgi:NAD(P) transhydrogenase subunit beta
MNIELLINLAYVAASVLFIYGLKMLSSPATARKGNLVSAVGMLIAVVATLFNHNAITWTEIAVGGIAGSVVGAVAARRVAMTGMPEMVALFNGFGGLASLLVGWAALYTPSSTFVLVTIALAILIGGVTFTGSVMAWAKLSESFVSGRPFQFRGQRVFNGALLAAIVASGVMLCLQPGQHAWLYLLVVLSFVLGVMVVIPIGGADMPVVISLLNSYSGLAGCAAGFAINNLILIVAGALVGASGIILTQIMCKAMNRSLGHVLFSGFGAVGDSAEKLEGEAKAISHEDAYYVLEASGSVVIVPGYGMAVAQAQHAVKELQELLEENGCEVVYAIHPVAGRMPGHMNVLLAEADVSYDLLLEMDEVNPRMANFDVAIVIGANDVVNPAAREVKTSSIYGMPVINVDQARTVFVLKRSMASGFAGIDNPLFFKENTRMLFGDAKESINHLIRQFK